MWSRVLDWLACPVCHNLLHLESFDESHVELAPEHLSLAKQRDLLEKEFNHSTISVALLCNS